jgi:hypothetical protein
MNCERSQVCPEGIAPNADRVPIGSLLSPVIRPFGLFPLSKT